MGRLWPGGTLLLYAEQGSGDTLQFIRFVPQVKERGGRVLVCCHQTLIPLLGCCAGVDRLTARGGPLPDFDFWAPLMSLPCILGMSDIGQVPAAVPYVTADANLVQRWRTRLEEVPGLRVGIAWQGNPKYRDDRRRSIPLRHFEPLSRLEGVKLFSLQKGPGTDQLLPLADRSAVIDLGSTLDEEAGPFMDTAAVMTSLDLVITSDTSIAHLAGALGVPVWVALTKVPEWRWLLDRADSPWYPTMRLFRQIEAGNWDEVFSRIAAETARMANRSGQS